MISIYDPVLYDLVKTMQLATGKNLTGWHRDDDPPRDVVASLLCGRKIGVFASNVSRKAAQMLNVKDIIGFENFT